MKKLISKIRNKIPGFEEKQYLRVRPWLKIEGDKTLRLNYELNESSVIIDLGGFEGQWASDIYSMYNSNIYIFEPYIPFYTTIEKRFIKNNKIKVFPFGLQSEDNKIELYIDSDKSSLIKNGKSKISIIELKNAEDFLKQENIKLIDLIKINIEGGEYDLLNHLINSNIIQNIKNLQIQFHDFVEGADSMMPKIRKELSITHSLTYCYDYVWENWKLK